MIPTHKIKLNLKWLVCLLLLAFNMVFAEDTKSKITFSETKEFSIITLDGVNANRINFQKIKLKGSYTKGDDEPYVLKFINEDGNEDIKSSNDDVTIQFEEPLSINVFIEKFLTLVQKGCKNKNDSIKSIKRESNMEVYIWLIRAANSFDDDNISGALHLNSFVKIYQNINNPREAINKTNADYYSNIDDRREAISNIISEINSKLFMPIDSLMQESILKKYNDKLLETSKVISELTKKIEDHLNNLSTQLELEKKLSDINSKKMNYETELSNVRDQDSDTVRKGIQEKLKLITENKNDLEKQISNINKSRSAPNEIEKIKQNKEKLELEKSNIAWSIEGIKKLIQYVNTQASIANNTFSKESLVSMKLLLNLNDTVIRNINELTALKGMMNSTDKVYLNNTIVDSRLHAKANLLNYLNEKQKGKSIDVFLKEVILNKLEYSDNDKMLKYLDKIYKIRSEINSLENLKQYNNLSKIKNIKVQFENGFIENLQVSVENDNNPLLIFENSYPIGFSSNYNYQMFDRIMLFVRNAEELKNENDFIYVSEVFMSYENLLENNRRDFSCGDTSFNTLKPYETPVVILKRDKSVNLFDTRVYTDLFGLSDKNPNGLVQTEIRRRFNLFTHRYQLSNLVNAGYVNYLTAMVCVSKLEDKERFLELHNDRNFTNNQLVSPSYATTIDYLKYEALFIGMESNVVTIGVPNGKVSFYFDMGIRYSRIPVKDSIRSIVDNRYTANLVSDLPVAGLVTWYPKISADIKSDNRLGFDINFTLNNSTLLSNNLYKAISSYSKSNTDAFYREPNSRLTETFEFNARYLPDRTNPGNKVFARFRLTWQVGDMNTFYPQMQFGYSYKLKYTSK